MKKVLLFIVSLFLVTNIVNAQLISVEDIVNDVKANIPGLDMVVDSTNHKINVMDGENVFISFDYTNEYIVFNDNTNLDTLTYEESEKNFSAFICIIYLYNSFAKLSGYNYNDIELPDGVDLDYETYGFEVDTEKIEVTKDGQRISGDFIKHFKFSLDTVTIEKLANDYGTTNNTSDVLKPTLSLIKTGKNSVTFNISMDNSDITKTYSCYIYRSTELNGTYNKISEDTFNLSKSMDIMDTNLETNTTYYYKAVLKDGTEFSNILTAKTLEGGEIVVNPNTGIGQQLLLILVTLITSGVVYLLIKNKSISLN